MRGHNKEVVTHYDVEVSDVLDVDDDAVAPKRHRAQFADGLIAYFQSEDDACSFQRMWRALIGLDPQTGDLMPDSTPASNPQDKKEGKRS